MALLFLLKLLLYVSKTSFNIQQVFEIFFIECPLNMQSGGCMKLNGQLSLGIIIK